MPEFFLSDENFPIVYMIAWEGFLLTEVIIL